jgi:CAAX protease family protein
MFLRSTTVSERWVLLPISLVLSWLLNVVRIAALFTIGVRGNPELAMKGFHSHAGWLMFSILAFTIIGVSTAIPWNSASA